MARQETAKPPERTNGPRGVLELARNELRRIEREADAVSDARTTRFPALRREMWRHGRGFRSVLQPLLSANDTTREQSERTGGEYDAINAQLDALERLTVDDAWPRHFGDVRAQLTRYLVQTMPALLDQAARVLDPATAAALVPEYVDAGRRGSAAEDDVAWDASDDAPTLQAEHSFPTEVTVHDALAHVANIESRPPETGVEAQSPKKS